jgi:hypothetical protein
VDSFGSETAVLYRKRPDGKPQTLLQLAPSIEPSEGTPLGRGAMGLQFVAAWKQDTSKQLRTAGSAETPTRAAGRWPRRYHTPAAEAAGEALRSNDGLTLILSVSDIESSSLAGLFAFILSNLCTRNIPDQLTPSGHHDWPNKRLTRGLLAPVSVRSTAARFASLVIATISLLYGEHHHTAPRRHG